MSSKGDTEMTDLELGGSPTEETAGGMTRRRMMGYLIAAPTLVAAARWADPAQGAIPTVQLSDTFDLSDLLNLAAASTAGLVSVRVNSDGTASFDLHRAEVGQGITTATAMLIADEMDIPVNRVRISLADARPDLLFNQLTGGSNSMHSIYTPVRTAAAAARGQLVQAAAAQLGVSASDLTVRNGVISARDGRSATFGSLARKARVTRSAIVAPQLKTRAALRIVGTDQKRIDGPDIVRGTKQFAMDLDVPGALPTMVCRPPTINGRAVGIRNAAEVKSMPGITDVAIIPHTLLVPGGVAVRGKTFGQCIDAIRALKVSWSNGTAEGKSDASVLADLKGAELPLTPALPGKSVEEVFTFRFRPGDPLETNCAIADVRSGGAEIWSCCKSPVQTQQQIATTILKMPLAKVKVHVTEGGGSFGRHLFSDAAYEAAAISKVLRKPVKLMWARTDNFRQGRVHPMATSRVRMTYSCNNVLSHDQRHTSVATDFSHGFGDAITAVDAQLPLQNFVQFSETIFTLTQNVPYNFGVVTQLLNEVYDIQTFNTSSVRNIYSPDVRTASELVIDRVADEMGKDRLALRREFAKDDRMRAVLDKLAQEGGWGRTLPAGMAQGVAVHHEYKGRAACIVEIDTRPETVGRKIAKAYTGPRVTKVVYVVDVGLPINPLGLRAQMMGGVMDGIAQVLSYSLHLKDGYFLEGSWDDAHYTRQWNTPPELQVIVMPQTTNDPGGAGEFGVAATMAATACAYRKATGTMPTEFPLNHAGPIDFEVFPTIPSIPQSPTDGLKVAGLKRPRKKKRSTKKQQTTAKKKGN
jgi:isoquinoline 1-oxidoreductase beta subunit